MKAKPTELPSALPILKISTELQQVLYILSVPLKLHGLLVIYMSAKQWLGLLFHKSAEAAEALSKPLT